METHVLHLQRTNQSKAGWDRGVFKIGSRHLSPDGRGPGWDWVKTGFDVKASGIQSFDSFDPTLQHKNTTFCEHQH